MDTNLRPLTLGEILDRTAHLYRSNFLLFAGISSLYAAVALVISLAEIGVAQFVQMRHLTHLGWLSPAVVLVGIALLLLMLGAVVAAMSRAVAAVHLGERVTIRGAYASTLPRFGRYLWLSAMTSFLAWWPLVVIWIGFVVTLVRYRGVLQGAANPTGAAGTPAQQQAALVMGVIFIVFGLLGLPAVVYSVWMALRYALAVPACVVENIKARAAVGRSIELSKGARGRIFVLLLLIVVINFGVSAITQSFLVVVALKHHGQIPVGLNVLSQVIKFFTTTVLTPIGGAGITLFYFDQRVRKEGFDIEWMMQAAGLASATGLDTATAVSDSALSHAEISASVGIPEEPVHE